MDDYRFGNHGETHLSKFQKFAGVFDRCDGVISAFDKAPTISWKHTSQSDITSMYYQL